MADRRESRVRELETRIRNWAHNIVTMLGPDHPFVEQISTRLVGFDPGDRFRVAHRRPLSLAEVCRLQTMDDLTVAQGALDMIIHRVRAEKELHASPAWW
jgi:hypothetical protein